MERILLTGHSGFLGTIIKKHFEQTEFDTICLGRTPSSDIVCDLSKDVFSSDKKIDYVIHVAGKAHHISKAGKKSKEFFKVNYLGTVNLIESLKKNKPKSIVYISSVAVYGLDKGCFIDENYSLLGKSAYAKSKILAEDFLRNYGKENNINVVILRLPLITGENPVGNLYNITKAIKNKYYFRIGKGNNKKSIVSATDVAAVIPELFHLNGTFNFTNTDNFSIREIDTFIARKYNRKIISLPFYLVKIVSIIGNLIPIFPLNSSSFNKLTSSLTFSSEKIFKLIKLRPQKGLHSIK